MINWNTGINAEVVLGGLFSGLAATGLHQAFTNVLKEKYDESEITEDEDEDVIEG